MEVAGKKLTIIGAKKSGIAAAKLLKKHGANVTISEKDSLMNTTIKDRLDEMKVDYEFGGHTDRAFECETAIISPGVPTNAPIVQEFKKRGIRVLSEVELGCLFCKATIVGVTGSEGKTTTVTLIKKILEADGKQKNYKALAVGNIGQPFCDYVDSLSQNDVAVVETSSFQLEYVYSYKPHVAVITNISPNHLDRHDSFEQYENTKYKIFQNQSDGDFLIYDSDNEVLNKKFTKSFRKTLNMESVPMSLDKMLSSEQEVSYGEIDNEKKMAIKLKNKTKEVIIGLDDISQNINFQGKHNLYNALSASAATLALNVEKETIRKGIMSFEGVEHRLEFVRRIGDVQFINDSKATSLNATKSALQTLKSPIILILGGIDKGNNYKNIVSLVKAKVLLIIALGESKQKIFDFFKNVTDVQKVATLDEAVDLASKKSFGFATVLLSPACSSFDMFQGGFEERGAIFKKLVNNLKNPL